MDKHLLKQLLKNLQIIMRCPHCGKEYTPDDMHLNGFNGQTYMLKMQCSNCNLPVNASITVNGQSKIPQMPKMFGFNSLKLPKQKIDITPPQAYKPKNKQKKFKKPISTNDVIDFHVFLKDFKGRLDNIK